MIDDHWRNTQKPARFFAFDARSFLGVFLFLVHARQWTLILAGVIIVIFWFFERYGLTFEASLRAIRCWSIGNNRPANSRRALRRWIDYGAFDPVAFLKGPGMLPQAAAVKKAMPVAAKRAVAQRPAPKK